MKKLFSETLLKLDSDNEFIYRVVKVVYRISKRNRQKKMLTKKTKKMKMKKRETIVSEEENCSNSLKCDVRSN